MSIKRKFCVLISNVLSLLNFLFLLIFTSLVALQRRPIYSVFSFIFLIFCLFINFFILGFYFIGICLLLLYIGAIAVLFLFVIISLPNLEQIEFNRTVKANDGINKNRYHGLLPFRKDFISLSKLFINKRKVINVVVLIFGIKLIVSCLYCGCVIVQQNIFLNDRWMDYIIFVEQPYCNTILSSTISDLNGLGLMIYGTSINSFIFIINVILLLVGLFGSSTILLRVHSK